jgi:lysophospholipase L1-like esterase
MLSRKVIVVALLTAVLGTAALFFRRGEPVRNLPVTGEGVVIVGDSLVYGTGSDSGGFVSRVSALVGIPVANYGVPGDTASQGLARVPSVLAKHPRPAVAMVLLGGNDYLRDVPKQQTFRDLRQIITSFQQAGAAVIILGVRGGVLRDGYSDEFERLARETGSVLVPDVLDGVFGVPRLMADAIHPNDAGYAIIAERVAPVLVSVLRGDVR